MPMLNCITITIMCVYLSVPVTETCSMYDALGVCQNGGSCVTQGDLPTCQ